MAVRTIIFRGKRIDNGEWVEGSYCHAEKLDRSGDEHFIIKRQNKPSETSTTTRNYWKETTNDTRRSSKNT